MITDARLAPHAGKSYFAWYVLVRRLLKGLPTIMHSEKGLCLFSNFGVHVLSAKNKVLAESLNGCPDLMSLTDSDVSKKTLPSAAGNESLSGAGFQVQIILL